jgi:hypothetical protein
VAKEPEYVTSEQLLQRLAQCESCGYVFQKGDRCFEKMGPDSYLRHCPGCSATTVFHAIAVLKQEKEKTKRSERITIRKEDLTPELFQELNAQLEGLSEQEFDRVTAAFAARPDNYFASKQEMMDFVEKAKRGEVIE